MAATGISAARRRSGLSPSGNASRTTRVPARTGIAAVALRAAAQARGRRTGSAAEGAAGAHARRTLCSVRARQLAASHHPATTRSTVMPLPFILRSNLHRCDLPAAGVTTGSGGASCWGRAGVVDCSVVHMVLKIRVPSMMTAPITWPGVRVWLSSAHPASVATSGLSRPKSAAVDAGRRCTPRNQSV